MAAGLVCGCGKREHFRESDKYETVSLLDPFQLARVRVARLSEVAKNHFGLVSVVTACAREMKRDKINTVLNLAVAACARGR